MIIDYFENTIKGCWNKVFFLGESMSSLKIDYFYHNIRKIGCWLRKPRKVRHFLNRALWEAGFPWTKLSPMPLEKIFYGINCSKELITVKNPFARFRGTSIELEELIVALAIVKHIGATSVLEIGTFDGNTALNFALNVGVNGSVVTIDLPPEGIKVENECSIIKPAEFIYRQYIGEPIEERIHQVYGDSAQLDWGGLGGPFDLTFIDGDHTEPYVINDTINTLSVLRPGGIIIWHDYELKGVAGVLDKAVEKGELINWIQGTRFAVATFKNPIESIKSFQD
jgi:predicted O-methyltransferase YrrM